MFMPKPDYEEMMLQISDVMREANRLRPILSHEQAVKNIRGIVERPKGKWIFDQEENVLTQTGEFVATYHCSECGKKIKTVESYLSKNHCFCSVCGARMER